MGYTTDFTGSFKLSKQPTPEQVAYINKFAETRRVKRNAAITETFPDPIRLAVGLPVGFEGAYYVDDMQSGRLLSIQEMHKAHNERTDIIDQNTPPGQPTYEEMKGVPFNEAFAAREKAIAENKATQPSLWCQWILQKDDDGELWEVAWDGGEKFYNYVEWIQYLIHHFFNRWDIKLTGQVRWVGEDSSDLGMIEITDSVVKVLYGEVIYTTK